MAEPFAKQATPGRYQRTESDFIQPSQILRQQSSIADKLTAKFELDWAGRNKTDKSVSGLETLELWEIESDKSASKHVSLPISDAKPPDPVTGGLSSLAHTAKSPEISGLPKSNSFHFHNAKSFLSSNNVMPRHKFRYQEDGLLEPAIRRRAVLSVPHIDKEITGSNISEDWRPQTFHSVQGSDPARKARVRLQTSSGEVSTKDEWTDASSQATLSAEQLVLHDSSYSNRQADEILNQTKRSQVRKSLTSDSTTQASTQTVSRKGSTLGDFLTGTWQMGVCTDKKPKSHDKSQEVNALTTQNIQQYWASIDNGQLQETLTSHESNQSCQCQCQYHPQEDMSNQVSVEDAVISYKKATPPLPKTWAPSRKTSPSFQATHADMTCERILDNLQGSSVGSDASSTSPVTPPARQQTTEAHQTFPSYAPNIRRFSAHTVNESKSGTSPQTDDTTIRRTGIKRVQIIVTFGGPDELIVDAKLQKRRQHQG